MSNTNVANEGQESQNPTDDRELDRSKIMSTEDEHDDDEKLILDGEVYRPLCYMGPSIQRRIRVLMDRTEEDRIRLFLNGVHEESAYLEAHLEKASDEEAKDKIKAYLSVLWSVGEKYWRDLEALWSERDQSEYDEVLGEIETAGIHEAEGFSEGISPEILEEMDEVKNQLIQEATVVLAAHGQISPVPYWLDVRWRWPSSSPRD